MNKAFRRKYLFYFIPASAICFSLTSSQAFAVPGAEDDCQSPQASHTEVIKTASAFNRLVSYFTPTQAPLEPQAAPAVTHDFYYSDPGTASEFTIHITRQDEDTPPTVAGTPTGRTSNPEIQYECSTIPASAPPTSARPSLFSRFLPSMTASALTSAGIYPLDQLKVRLQNGTSSREAESTAQAAAENSAKTGFFSTVKEKLIHAYGPYDPAKGVLSYAKNSVYKGYVPYMTVMCSSTGIIYPLHDIFQRTLRNNLPETMSRADKSLYSNVAGGAAATAVSQVVNIPQYNYRTNQSLADLEGGKKYTPAGFVKEAIKNPKIATKGLGIAPAYSASMATYYYLFDRFKKEQLKKADKTTSSELTLFNNFLASSQARFLVSLGVHPFDTVRIRKQKTDQTYPQIAKGLYREGGIRRFYKGLAVSALRNSMSTGISMALYQKLRIWWEQENKPKAKD